MTVTTDRPTDTTAEDDEASRRLDAALRKCTDPRRLHQIGRVAFALDRQLITVDDLAPFETLEERLAELDVPRLYRQDFAERRAARQGPCPSWCEQSAAQHLDDGAWLDGWTHQHGLSDGEEPWYVGLHSALEKTVHGIAVDIGRHDQVLTVEQARTLAADIVRAADLLEAADGEPDEVAETVLRLGLEIGERRARRATS